MQKHKDVYLLGYASSIAGPNPLAGEGPIVLQSSPYLAKLKKLGLRLHWFSMIKPPLYQPSKLAIITEENILHATHVNELVENKKFFIVLGGDHSSAIGTWSGVFYSIQNKGPLGLIWIDAHMDSHTPETSLTGNYHGMPLATLLGYGDPLLTNILSKNPKVKPEHLCLIGIRSFEPAEEALLKKLKVRIYYMDEVNKRGLDIILREALAIVTNGTAGFGVSLDIDSIDPMDAPGTDVIEEGGIRAKELCSTLPIIAADPHLIGVEITEFDPYRDISCKTEKLIAQIIKKLTGF